MPAPTSLIVMPSTVWPWQHSAGAQSQDTAVLEHESGSYGSVPACMTNCLPLIPCVISSTVPLAGSINGFVALAEFTTDDIAPCCVLVDPRPIHASCTPLENSHQIHNHILHPSPPLFVAVPHNSHLLQGPMMFGALMESETPLVGIGTISGPVGSYPAAQCVSALASGCYHSHPAVLTTSIQQQGTNILALHGVVEATQPRELCDS